MKLKAAHRDLDLFAANADKSVDADKHSGHIASLRRDFRLDIADMSPCFPINVFAKRLPAFSRKRVCARQGMSILGALRSSSSNL